MIRCSHEEAEKIREMAKRERRTSSRYLLNAVLPARQSKRRPDRRKPPGRRSIDKNPLGHCYGVAGRIREAELMLKPRRNSSPRSVIGIPKPSFIKSWGTTRTPWT